MTKLIVQIPCYNEAAHLPETIAAIPRRMAGVDAIEILVIDDGSTDGTAEAARAAGADHVIVNKSNLGLARSFDIGLRACMARGADVIVNADGDNQYCGASIADLVQPVLTGQADIVVGDRGTNRIAHFSPLKKSLQRLGSAVVRRLSGLDLPDAVSGFRAYGREAALRATVFSRFSYTIETLIHAGNNGLTVMSVPVETNPANRSSRLSRSMSGFIAKQMVIMLRSYAMYRAMRFFSLIALVLCFAGTVPMIRFLVRFMAGEGQGNIQSLVMGGVLIVMGVVTFAVALLADAVAVNRRLIEEILVSTRRADLSRNDDSSTTPDRTHAN